MKEIIIYHNPRCSKSRQALDLLREHHHHPLIIEYLKNPLSLAELTTLSRHFPLEKFVRSEEKCFKELGLSLNDPQAVLEAMVKNPILMQRPIIRYKGKALIARPPEKVLEIVK